MSDMLYEWEIETDWNELVFAVPFFKSPLLRWPIDIHDGVVSQLTVSLKERCEATFFYRPCLTENNPIYHFFCSWSYGILLYEIITVGKL